MGLVGCGYSIGIARAACILWQVRLHVAKGNQLPYNSCCMLSYVSMFHGVHRVSPMISPRVAAVDLSCCCCCCNCPCVVSNAQCPKDPPEHSKKPPLSMLLLLLLLL